MPKKKKSNPHHISTQLAYLDLSVVLANYRNPEFWGRKWIIYRSGKIEIYWRMVEINVKHNYIRSEVGYDSFIFKRGRISTWLYGEVYPCDCIPINNPEYKQELFERNVLAASLKLVRSMELMVTYAYAEYHKAREVLDAQREKLREIAEEVASTYILSSPYAKDMRDAFVEKYVDDNLTDYPSLVLDRHDHQIFGGLYLMLCSWFGREEEFERHKKLVGDGRKQHLWVEMFAEAKRLQSEEWRNAMAKALEEEVM